mmetsp:Transcript_45939/g.91652  ORF Transcript_45939/g.91652 Transcript_45939/m.91652 type:complete len:84 (+) Transcript_45939:731-982(+)
MPTCCPLALHAQTLVCGTAGWIGRLWTLVKMVLPARTAAKVSLFPAAAHADFMKELLHRVDIGQVPEWCGGQASVPWPYEGEG